MAAIARDDIFLTTFLPETSCSVEKKDWNVRKICMCTCVQSRPRGMWSYLVRKILFDTTKQFFFFSSTWPSFLNSTSLFTAVHQIVFYAADHYNIILQRNCFKI